MNRERIVVVGLGYVGLPLAVALARNFEVIGLDIDADRILDLKAGRDWTGEVEGADLQSSTITLTHDPQECRDADIYIVTVPTPVDADNRPDLGPVKRASKMIAGLLNAARRPVVVYESTVYPGVTEEICGPLIEAEAGLVRGRDFFLGYSPERINPGDREHRIDTIVKVVAGEDDETIERLAEIYNTVTTAGIFRAASIKAAEAAKVIENSQRDINIAFINEITQIFARLDLSIWDVLEAAGTKWNFLPFQPGLVGGHCIGVDPYYLSFRAQELGHQPKVILTGRSTNDGMGRWVADAIHEARGGRSGSVLVLGLTFKEDVPDLRNSRVVDVIERLREVGHSVTVHDPLANHQDALSEYGLRIDPDALEGRYDVVFAAVPHRDYKNMSAEQILARVSPGGCVADLKGIWRGADFGGTVAYWTL